MSVKVQAAMKHERSQPLKDDSGRIHYIVDLADNVTKDYSDNTPVDARFGDWNKPAMHGVRRAFEAKYQFQATGIFSWVGNGFIAYLTPAQAKAIQRDPQVVRVTEDHAMEFSAVWANQPLAGTEIMPWNISAVSGNQLSGGSVRAYVLDAGVGYHSDLPNVISRISADPLMPIVGCYPHATHVAGIISAPRNGLGVVGVDSSVPVVSVSTSTTANATFNCGNSSSSGNISLGLDQIKSWISASGRVGVINISINTQDNTSNYFANTEPLGLKILSMATPTPVYPGAFIAQSAGNYGKLARDYAYNNLSINDGIMVVGAVDINGQPVVRLNSIDGFRSMPIAANQAGSNFGSSVAIWAPGNNIYSTWATWNAALADSSPTAQKARQSGNTTYNIYGQLSGTSMAAPHVAGVAAWLAETGNLTTPEQIEAAVRSYARTSGAKDPNTNLPILMANASGVSYTAQPTVEFAINGMVNGNFSTNSATPFTLRYESIGVVSCDLTGYLNNAVWYQNLGFNNNFNWGAVQLAPGNYRWVVNCRSAASTMNSAQAAATVTAPPPAATAVFSFNNVQQPNVTMSVGSSPWPSSASIKEISYGTQQPFNFSYNSTNTSSCSLNAFYAATFGAFWSAWYSVSAMPTYYSWPPVTLGFGYYWWQLTCTGTGGTVTRNFVAHVY